MTANEHSAPALNARRSVELVRLAKGLSLGAFLVSVLIIAADFTIVVMLLRRGDMQVSGDMRDILLIMLGGFNMALGMVVQHWLRPHTPVPPAKGESA
jgi:hypothetical protein